MVVTPVALPAVLAPVACSLLAMPATFEMSLPDFVARASMVLTRRQSWQLSPLPSAYRKACLGCHVAVPLPTSTLLPSSQIVLRPSHLPRLHLRSPVLDWVLQPATERPRPPLHVASAQLVAPRALAAPPTSSLDKVSPVVGYFKSSKACNSRLPVTRSYSCALSESSSPRQANQFRSARKLS